MDWLQKLRNQFGDKIKEDKKFSTLTTLKIGGDIKAFIEVNSQDELVEVLKFASKEQMPFLIIGGGSNLLVSDEGVDFLVIKNSVTGIDSGQSQNDRVKLIVQAGTVLQDLVDYTIEQGLEGLHKMTGVPGTVGGAIYGNAGAYGQTISEHITSVKFFDGENIKDSFKEECRFDYRSSIFKQNKDFVILEAEFTLEKNDPKKLEEESKDILAQRIKKYPPGIKCPGSFFKNIVASTLTPSQLAAIPKEKIVYGKVPAGTLLEDIGAKGARLGSIEIADYHANLFINKGGGKAIDFFELAGSLQKKVREKFGVELEPEVQLINLPSLD